MPVCEGCGTRADDMHISRRTVRLELAIGSNADTWLRLQMNYDLAQIRNRVKPLKVTKLAKLQIA